MTVREVKAFCNEHQINADRMKIYKHGGLIHIEMADIPKELIEKNLKEYEETGSRRNIPEIDRLIRRYNRQAKRLVKLLPIGFCGFRCGTGEWDYREGSFTASEELAFNNMD